MKMNYQVLALVIPIALSACNTRQDPTTEKLDAGADEIAVGVKKMVEATKERTGEAIFEGKQKLGRNLEDVSVAATDAKQKFKDVAGDAAAATHRVVEDTRKAALEATEKSQEAVDPD